MTPVRTPSDMKKQQNDPMFSDDMREDLTPDDLADPDSYIVTDPETELPDFSGLDLLDTPVRSTRRLAPPRHPGEHLREALDNHDIKHKVFATAIGIPPTDLSNIINGRRPLSPSNAARVAKALGSSVEMWVHFQAARDAYQEKTDPKKVQAVEHIRPLVLA